MPEPGCSVGVWGKTPHLDLHKKFLKLWAPISHVPCPSPANGICHTLSCPFWPLPLTWLMSVKAPAQRHLKHKPAAMLADLLRPALLSAPWGWLAWTGLLGQQHHPQCHRGLFHQQQSSCDTLSRLHRKFKGVTQEVLPSRRQEKVTLPLMWGKCLLSVDVRRGKRRDGAFKKDSKDLHCLCLEATV